MWTSHSSPRSVRTLRNDGTMIWHTTNGMRETSNLSITVPSWQGILMLWQHRVQCEDDEPNGEARNPGPAPGASDGKVSGGHAPARSTANGPPRNASATGHGRPRARRGAPPP